MEFNEKLQELRKSKGLTQEELAQALYVSRTAVSKWESGRGYPNIESLKEISRYFSVSIDELICPDEIITAAENEKRETINKYTALIGGLSDIFTVLLLFIPVFGNGRQRGSRAAFRLDRDQPVDRDRICGSDRFNRPQWHLRRDNQPP